MESNSSSGPEVGSARVLCDGGANTMSVMTDELKVNSYVLCLHHLPNPPDTLTHPSLY